jgi:hypothetical protein
MLALPQRYSSLESKLKAVVSFPLRLKEHFSIKSIEIERAF